MIAVFFVCFVVASSGVRWSEAGIDGFLYTSALR